MELLYKSTDGDLRMHRLKKVVCYVCKLLDIKEQQLELLVESIYDNKGVLYVCWHKCEPTDKQKSAFGTAWQLCLEEHDRVAHTWND